LIFYFSYSCNTFLLFPSPATDGGRLGGGVKKFFYHNSFSFHCLGALPFAQRFADKRSCQKQFGGIFNFPFIRC